MVKPFTLFICLLVLVTSCLNQEREPVPSEAGDEWTVLSTTHFRLHAQKGVRSEKALKEIGEKLERIQHTFLKLLKESSKQKLEVYFLKDRQTLTSYTGFPARGYTDTQKGIIYFADKDPFHLALQHEVMHALSWRLWGPPIAYWLSEGLAVFAAGTCGGYSFHALSNDIDDRGLESFSNMTDSFDFASLDQSLQAASMVQYIYENYGIEGVKGFWKNGWKNAQAITGSSPAALHQRWIGHIRKQKFETSINWKAIQDSGCE